MEKSPKKQSSCEDCLYFDFDEEMQENVCTMVLDEDEMERFMSEKNAECPYYRFYDEYKLVKKQN